jgi:protein-tyrosine phosphatase
VPVYHPMLFTYMHLRVRDSFFEPLTNHFDAAVDFIASKSEAGGGVMVHCYAGMSRSATLVLAYLLRERNMSLDDALVHVKSRRDW